MITYLFNSEIDKDKWDNCIKNSPGVKPYAYSWYLDILAPGWQALVDDDYDSVFPVTGFKRYGIQYIATPIFVQQLGVFSPDKPAQSVINEFLNYIPDFYKLIDLSIGQKTTFDGFKVTEKVNFELDLSKPYDILRKNFERPCRRNLEKSMNLTINLTYDISPEELIDLFKRNKGRIIKGIGAGDLQKLKGLMTYCLRTGKGRIVGVRNSENKIIFGQFLLEIPGSLNLFFGVNTEESREKRINYFVINEIIRENATRDLILDFAGSSIPSIATFMKSFGGLNIPYYRIYRNRLFWPARLLK